jgi:hypothetical protein
MLLHTNPQKCAANHMLVGKQHPIRTTRHYYYHDATYRTMKVHRLKNNVSKND